MGLVAVDVTADEIIQWFDCYPDAERERPAIGACPHECAHRLTATVAWGADLKHYELHTCDDPDGCNSDCRGWLAAEKSGRELWNDLEWKLLGPVTA